MQRKYFVTARFVSISVVKLFIMGIYYTVMGKQLGIIVALKIVR